MSEEQPKTLLAKLKDNPRHQDIFKSAKDLDAAVAKKAWERAGRFWEVVVAMGVAL